MIIITQNWHDMPPRVWVPRVIIWAMWMHLWRTFKTLTSAHQKPPDPLWKCVLRPTRPGILSLFRPESELPAGVCVCVSVCVNLNTHDSISVYGYDGTYAVRISANGGVIALMCVCVCVCVCRCACVSAPRWPLPPSFFSLANFTWACAGSGWEIISLARLWKLFAISVDWLEPQSGPCQPGAGVVERGCRWGWN